MGWNPEDRPPLPPLLGIQYSHSPLGVATLFASIALGIQDGVKVPVYWKDGKIHLSEAIAIPFGVEEPNPFWVGYIFSNQRYSHMTNVYYLHQPLWEYSDQKSQIRSQNVFADLLFKGYRKWTTSSIIETEEAIQIVAECFMKWHYTKEIINKIFAQNFDPNTGKNSSMVLK